MIYAPENLPQQIAERTIIKYSKIPAWENRFRPEQRQIPTLVLKALKKISHAGKKSRGGELTKM
jgi:hypothetical protein